jgi:hypothetical protein
MRQAIREALEHAPASGPVAPDLRGVWVEDGGWYWYVCAPCVGRLIGRGCGHLTRGEVVWAGGAEPYGVCCGCGK